MKERGSSQHSPQYLAPQGESHGQAAEMDTLEVLRHNRVGMESHVLWVHSMPGGNFPDRHRAPMGAWMQLDWGRGCHCSFLRPVVYYAAITMC